MAADQHSINLDVTAKLATLDTRVEALAEEVAELHQSLDKIRRAVWVVAAAVLLSTPADKAITEILTKLLS